MGVLRAFWSVSNLATDGREPSPILVADSFPTSSQQNARAKGDGKEKRAPPHSTRCG
jgi:hypothetical protein